MALLILALGCGGASFGMGGGTTQAGSAPPELPAAEPDGGGSWTLAEREFWTKLQEELDEFSKHANDHCHSQVTASYSKDSYRGKLTAGGSYGMPQFTRAICTGALDSLRDVCLDGDAAKQAVAANIRHVQCALGKTGYALGKGTFYVTYNPDESDQLSHYTEAMMAFIRSHI